MEFLKSTLQDAHGDEYDVGLVNGKAQIFIDIGVYETQTIALTVAQTRELISVLKGYLRAAEQRKKPNE